MSEKFIKKWFWLYLFSFIIAPIWYIIKIIISNELTVEEVWIVYSVISLVTLFWSFNDFDWQKVELFFTKIYRKKDYSKAKSVLTYTLLTNFNKYYNRIIFAFEMNI